VIIFETALLRLLQRLFINCSPQLPTILPLPLPTSGSVSLWKVFVLCYINFTYEAKGFFSSQSFCGFNFKPDRKFKTTINAVTATL